jgi:hypothetical protein
MYRRAFKEVADSEIDKMVNDYIQDADMGGEGARDLLEMKGDLETVTTAMTTIDQKMQNICDLSLIVADQYPWLSKPMLDIAKQNKANMAAVQEVYDGVEEAWDKYKQAGGKSLGISRKTLLYMGLKATEFGYTDIASAALDLLNSLDKFSTTSGLGRGSAIVDGSESLKESDPDLYKMYERVQENYSNFKGSLIALQEYADQATRDIVIRD